MTLARPFIKPPLTHQEQVKLLIDRGIVVPDPEQAEQLLCRINYYRLTAYCYPFRQPDHTYAPGTTLDEVVRLYEFDRRLRLLVLDAIERVEVQLRMAVAYTLAHAFGPFAHEDASHFEFEPNPPGDHATWLDKLHIEIRRSKEVFIEHYKAKYQGYPSLPSWVAVEVMGFGSLSRLFEALRTDQKRAVSKFFGVHHKILESWAHVLSSVRNLCAHHARLWNRELGVKAKLIWKNPDWTPAHLPDNGRSYCVLLILRQLTRDHHAADDWAEGAIALLHEMDSFPRWQQAMGMPANWAAHPLWRL